MSLKLVEIENKQCFQCSEENVEALCKTLDLLDDLYGLLNELNYELADINETYFFLDNLLDCINTNENIYDYFDYYEKNEE